MPTYIPGSGRLATDRYDFKSHTDGYSLHHTSSEVNLSSPVIINGTSYTTNVQDTLTALASVITVTIPDATSVVKGKLALAGDLSGTADSPTVVKLQNKPVSTLAPTAGQVLTWNLGNYWEAANATAGFTASGDLSGTSTTQTVVGLQAKPLSATAPTNGQIMGYDGYTWKPTDQIAFSGDLTGNLTTQNIWEITGYSAFGANSVNFKADNLYVQKGINITSGNDRVSAPSDCTIILKAASSNTTGVDGADVRIFGGFGTDSSSGGVVSIFGGINYGTGAQGSVVLCSGYRNHGILSVDNPTGTSGVVSIGGYATSTTMPAGTGDGVLYLANASTIPSTGVPTSGIEVYSYDGNLRTRSNITSDGYVYDCTLGQNELIAQTNGSIYYKKNIGRLTTQDTDPVTDLYKIVLGTNGAVKLKATLNVLLTSYAAASSKFASYEMVGMYHNINGTLTEFISGASQIQNSYGYTTGITTAPSFTMTGVNVSFFTGAAATGGPFYWSYTLETWHTAKDSW